MPADDAKAGAPSAAPEEDGPSPDYLEVASLRFLVTCPHDPDAVGTKSKLLALVQKRSMAPFYKALCEKLGWAPEGFLAELEAANAAELAKLEEKIKDAAENEGETEIREAYLAKADFLMRIGEKEIALAAYDETLTKTVALGPKLDVVLAKLRIGFFFDDLPLVKETLEKGKAMLEEGGDWERRNRMKVYEALFLIQVRDFKKATALLLDSIATFTASELLPYNTFVLYTVACSLVALPRAEIKKKVIDAPEILQVIEEIPVGPPLLNSLYACQYRSLLAALVELMPILRADRVFHAHARWYWRELRALAYGQFLEAYKSVSLASMANSFGVSTAFLDEELSAFIAAGRLPCKIDKVSAVVSSTRPDTKNAQYLAAIKEGDLLLNRVQKLSRVIDVGGGV